MHINQAGLDLIKQFEGFRAVTYYDVGGKPTIGYGHLIKKGEHFTKLTHEQAEKLLRQDVAEAECAVNRHVKVKLTENQFSALVSWVFNLGEGSFASSTLLKVLNKQQYINVPEQMLRWHRVSRQPIKGLIRRRAAEAMLFIS